MNKNWCFSFMLAGLSVLIFSGFTSSQFVWQSQGQQWQGAIQDIVIQDQLAYVATTKGVFSYLLEKRNIRRPKQLLRMSAYDVEINDDYWLAAGVEGVFKSENHGQSWDRIFNVDDEIGEIAYHVLDFGDGIAIGTNKGFYYRLKSTLRWHKLSGVLTDQNIYDLDFDEEFIYAMTPFSVISVDRQTWKSDVVYQYGSTQAQDDQRALRSLLLDEKGKLWLVTRQHILTSGDQGETWNIFNQGSAPFHEAYQLLIQTKDSVPILYLATKKGVFILDDDTWVAAYQGLDQTRVNALAFNASDDVYVGGVERLYMLKEYEISHEEKEYRHIQEVLQYEPSVVHVQRRAILYAEVHPQKINGWRQRARWSGVLPSVDVDVARNTDELYHWDNASTSVPDKITKGKDFTDWDFSVSWDFSKLIWNDDQIDIDTRSRLMVELREDILDQVTRIYFERRRLQGELMLMEEAEMAYVMEKQLRIEELTAQLDAYTGGWFSEKVKGKM